MKRIIRWLKDFFLPPPGTPTWVRVLPYGILGLLTLMLLTASAYAWEYTNSPEFCGTSCHTMPPEYTAYLTSPHARVDCVDCHIGKGFIATRITRKAGDIRHITATAFQTYEFPIRAKNMRPARETCELCHFPEKFSDDSMREIRRFSNDQANTPMTTYLIMKTGGGSKRLGLGRGIHWHIENKVDFVALDREQQIIPFVRVYNDDGSITEYADISAEMSLEEVAPEQWEEMDCITCHNRITHMVPPPEDTVDQLLERGLISPAIPDIRRKSVEVYGAIYDTVERGLRGIEGLTNYYQTYYPDFYNSNASEVDQAITVLKETYIANVFPEQNSDWTTHPNNIGHKEFPGCFRCHDGEHLNAAQEAIRLECNICHAIPVVAGPDDFIAEINVSRGPEPETHQNPNWIALHHEAFNDSCANCHTTEDPGGTSNTSFCSNSACHGNVWEHAGFDAPALREVILPQLPPTPTPVALPEGEEQLTYQSTIGPLLTSRCSDCHGESGIAGLDLTTYEGLLEGGDSGPAVVPGDPESSILVQKQTGDTPHFSQLPPLELNLVIQWIEEGAPQ